MDGWVKGLIAVICIGLIGGIGYLIVADSNDRRHSGKVARIKLDSIYCQERLAQIHSGKMSADDIPVVEDCFVNGFVSQSDVVAAFKAATKKRNGG